MKQHRRNYLLHYLVSLSQLGTSKQQLVLSRAGNSAMISEEVHIFCPHCYCKRKKGVWNMKVVKAT